jgi:hemoglobin
MSESIYHRYGGFETVHTVITRFYRKVLAEPLLAPHFRHTNMDRLVDHQTHFVAMVLGGPKAENIRDLNDAHAHLRIRADEFDLVKDLLEESLLEQGVTPDDTDSVMTLVESTRPLIVAP